MMIAYAGPVPPKRDSSRLLQGPQAGQQPMHWVGGAENPQRAEARGVGHSAPRGVRAAPQRNPGMREGGGSQPEIQDRQAEPYLGQPAQTSSGWAPASPGRR